MKMMFPAMSVLMLLITAAYAAPVITANSVSISVAADQTQGSSVITWDAENNNDAEVWLKVDDPRETKFYSDSTGVKPFTLKIGSKYAFRLYSQKPFPGPLGNPLSRVLASTVVNAYNPRPETPPGASPGGSASIVIPPKILPATIVAPIPPPAPSSTPAYLYL